MDARDGAGRGEISYRGRRLTRDLDWLRPPSVTGGQPRRGLSITVAAQTPPLKFDTIEEAIDAVRQGGMRLSTARRLVLEAFFAAEGPVSAVHLARILLIDESSVYRNLEVLERHGLIRHVHLGHGPGLYVLVGREQVEYLYCERCAKVTAVPPERLDPVRREIKRDFGYEARFTHFAIVGLCAQCATPRRPESGAHSASDDAVQEAHGHHHYPKRDLASTSGDDELTHSHGDFVHSHPHAHAETELGHER